MEKHWEGKRIVILGAARQGVALARYLARHGSQVTLSDLRTADQLQEARSTLAGYTIKWVLGEHPTEMLRGADLLCVSGGVPLNLPIVQAARENNILISNDTQVFMEMAPCKVVGITGSAGKTTTTTVLGRIAQAGAANRFGRVWVGGNIGDPLINYLDEMQPADLAILELSSFQLEQVTTSPSVGAILNITPNHLDRHGTMQEYIRAKARLITHQTAQDTTVLGRDNPTAWDLREQVRGRLLSFGTSPLTVGDGMFEEDEKFFMRENGKTERIPVEDAIELRGDHNRLNVMAACTIAHALGFGVEDMLKGIEGFRGVPHRLEFVRAWHGAQFYNDSIATAPERASAAIKSFSTPLVLLLGGRDKNLPWEELGELVRQRVDHVVVFGEAADVILAALGERIPGSRPFSVARCDGVRAAVQAAARLAQPGYVVLFAPGGTSFDEFKDFEERGEAFKKWVQELS
jgi:UDP-N-acetylmuramoylalanine--D-glutamate ligase